MKAESYTLEVAGLTRALPLVEIKKGLKIASFVMLGDTKLIEHCASALYTQLQSCAFDYIVCPEAKAIPLAHSLSVRKGVDYIVLRKSVKAYMESPVAVKVNSITTTKTQDLVLNGPDADKIYGKKVCVLDDVISTGSSLTAAKKLLKKVKSEISCMCAVLLEEGGYKGTDLIYLEKLPVFKT